LITISPSVEANKMAAGKVWRALDSRLDHLGADICATGTPLLYRRAFFVSLPGKHAATKDSSIASKPAVKARIFAGKDTNESTR